MQKPTQDNVIQLRVSKEFKDRLDKIARLRGLPTSTYIKIALTEYLKSEKFLEDLDMNLKKEEILRKIYKKLK